MGIYANYMIKEPEDKQETEVERKRPSSANAAIARPHKIDEDVPHEILSLKFEETEEKDDPLSDMPSLVQAISRLIFV